MSLKSTVRWSREDLESHVSGGLDNFEGRLEAILVDSRGLVNDLLQHLSRAGGKRMRPALVMLCAHLGEDGVRLKPEPSSGRGKAQLYESGSASVLQDAVDNPVFAPEIMNAAAVIELTHLATLYHDDVMDSAPTRRGVPSAQRVWGNNRAVLAGDLIFARASYLVAELGPQAVKEHAHTFSRLCRGQINESFGPGQDEDPVSFYLQVLADKTGSLVAQAARFGALLSGADQQVAQQVYEFGDQVGVAFQIADDVIDLGSDGDVSGKTPGTDLREGVTTLPTLLLEQREREGRLDQNGATILDRWRNFEQLQDEQILADTVALMRKHEVLAETRRAAFEWANRAKAALDELPNQAVHEALCEFADSLVDRIS